MTRALPGAEDRRGALPLARALRALLARARRRARVRRARRRMDRIVLAQFQERARTLAAPAPRGPAEGGSRALGYE